VGCTIGQGSATSPSEVVYGPAEPSDLDRGALTSLGGPAEGHSPESSRRRAGRVLEAPMAERPELLGLAAEIVSAHVSHNAVAADQLSRLIQQVCNALATAEQAANAPSRAKPAVAVKRSVFSDHMVCLDCGKSLTMLKRHLMTDHKLTPEQYRQRWELPFSYPLVAPNYAKLRSTLAKKIGLGQKGRAARTRAGLKAARKMATRR
jgi:predicted transcriptional regulator